MVSPDSTLYLCTCNHTKEDHVDPQDPDNAFLASFCLLCDCESFLCVDSQQEKG